MTIPQESPAPAIGVAPEAMGRRTFLRWLSGLGAAISASVIGVPVLRAILSPGLQTAPSENWVKVSDDTALLDIGVPIRLDFVQSQQDAWIQGRAQNSVWVYTEDGETFKAFNGHCTHLGCGYQLDDDKKTFTCPCHRGKFDAKSGAVLGGPPPRPLDELRVEVRDAAVYVDYREFRLGVPEKQEV